MGAAPVEQPQPFLKWVKSDSVSDFLQLVRYSDGTILGWIDSDGVRQGSLAGGGGGGSIGFFPAPYEVVSFSGVSGTLKFTPNGNFGPLIFRNGLLMQAGGVPGLSGYTIVGATFTLSVAAGPTEYFQAIYSHN